MELKTIILQEWINILTEGVENIDYKNMTLQNLIDIAVHMSKNQDNITLDRNIVEQLLTDAAKKGKEIEMFKDMTHLDVFSTRPGRYSFTPQVTPEDYEDKLE